MLPDPMAFTSDQLCDANFYQKIALVKAVVSWDLWRSKKVRRVDRNPSYDIFMTALITQPCPKKPCQQVPPAAYSAGMKLLQHRERTATTLEPLLWDLWSFWQWPWAQGTPPAPLSLAVRIQKEPHYPGQKDTEANRPKWILYRCLQPFHLPSKPWSPQTPLQPGQVSGALCWECKPSLMGVLGYTWGIPTQMPASRHGVNTPVLQRNLSDALWTGFCLSFLESLLELNPPWGGCPSLPSPVRAEPWKGIAGDEIPSWKWDSAPLFRNRNETCFTAPREFFQHKHPQLHVSVAAHVTTARGRGISTQVKVWCSFLPCSHC